MASSGESHEIESFDIFYLLLFLYSRYFVLIYPLASLLCGYKAVIFMKMIKNVYLSRIEENCGKEESIKA